MGIKQNRFDGLLLCCLGVALLAPLQAQADENDPPTRVARVAYAEGSVSFEPAGTEEWVAAALNRPVTSGDKLWSDQDGSATTTAVVRAPAGSHQIQRRQAVVGRPGPANSTCDRTLYFGADGSPRNPDEFGAVGYEARSFQYAGSSAGEGPGTERIGQSAGIARCPS
jgi:hypothetical protein